MRLQTREALVWFFFQILCHDSGEIIMVREAYLTGMASFCGYSHLKLVTLTKPSFQKK